MCVGFVSIRYQVLRKCGILTIVKSGGTRPGPASAGARQSLERGAECQHRKGSDASQAVAKLSSVARARAARVCGAGRRHCVLLTRYNSLAAVGGEEKMALCKV